MNRLTTDNPSNNFETLMNYVYAKDGEAFIRHDGITSDVPLWQCLDRSCEDAGCEINGPQGSEQTMERCAECAMEEGFCPIALMYIFATQAVECRGRLKQYEDAEDAK